MNDNSQNTHLLTSKKLVGEVVTLSKDKATVKLIITEEMVVDNYNLAHGSFVFGLADYAAMVAINEPTVVLGSADVKYLKPVILGDEVFAEATVINTKGKKVEVNVIVQNNQNIAVFDGNFICFVLDQHILE